MNIDSELDFSSDAEARASCLDIQHSFIVQAPAGSGKTELLIQRILKLLSVADEPESILAITFTRKAASEMRNRIIAALRAAQDLLESYQINDRDTLINSINTLIAEGSNSEKAKLNSKALNPKVSQRTSTPINSIIEVLANKSNHEQLTLHLAFSVIKQNAEKQWHLLENPNRLQLKTIDSFCSSIVFQLPILSGLGGKFSISEHADELYMECSRNFIKTLENGKPWSPALERLLYYLDIRSEQLEKLFSSMLAKRLQWFPFIAEFQKNRQQNNGLAKNQLLRKHMEEALNDINRSHIDKILYSPALQLLHELDSLLSFCSENVEEVSPIYLLRNCPPISSLTNTDLTLWKSISHLLLTKSGTWRSVKGVSKKIGFPPEKKEPAISKKKSFQNLLEELKHYPDFEILLKELRDLPSPTIDDIQLNITADICECLYVLLGYLQVLFQEHQLIDFNELQIKARDALSPDLDLLAPQESLAHNKPALMALDSKLQHILVDEYQDTSNSQLELLSHLISQWQYQNDGKTLFLVGDPMQSIYRFREANVGVFLQAQKNGIQNLSLCPLKLSNNYRSELGIIKWVNHIFSNSFPKHDNYHTGAIQYSPSIAFHHPIQNQKLIHTTTEQKHTEQNLPALNTVNNETATESHIIRFEHDIDQASELLGKRLCERISQIHAQNSKHNIQESIAILVRSKSHANYIIQSLKENNIPYQGLEIDVLSNCPHVLNLIHLCCAIVDLSDELSWFGLLRSSLIGIPNDDLLILQGSSITEHQPIAFTCLDTIKKTLLQLNISDTSKRILKRQLPIIKKARVALESQNIPWVIESCWLTLGGAATVESIYLEDCQNFFELLQERDSKKQRIDHKSLHKACERLFAAPSISQNNPISIMTIHKSKGLEFDHVFLPHLEKGTRSDEKQLLNWSIYEDKQKKPYFLLAPFLPSHSTKKNDLMYDYLSRIEKKKIQNESIRLLYVATTRAKKKLYLYAQLPHKIDNESGELIQKNPASNSLLALIWQTLKIETIHYHSMESKIFSVNNNKTETEKKNYQLKRLSADWCNIPILTCSNTDIFSISKKEKYKNKKLTKQQEDEQSIKFLLQKPNLNALLGTLVHNCIRQYIEATESERKKYWINNNKLNHFHNHWKRFIQSEKVFDKNNIDNIIKNCEICMQNLLADTKNSWIFDNKLTQSECELNLYYQTNSSDNRHENSLSNNKELSSIKHFIVDRSFIYQEKRWIIDYKTTEPDTSQTLDSFYKLQKEKYLKQLSQYALAFQGLENRLQVLALYFPKMKKLLIINN